MGMNPTDTCQGEIYRFRMWVRSAAGTDSLSLQLVQISPAHNGGDPLYPEGPDCRFPLRQSPTASRRPSGFHPGRLSPFPVVLPNQIFGPTENFVTVLVTTPPHQDLWDILSRESLHFANSSPRRSIEPPKRHRVVFRYEST